MNDLAGSASWPRFAMFGLVAVTLVAVMLSPGPQESREAALTDVVVEARSLRFVDGTDGSVQVFDADSGHRIKVFAGEGTGFIRGLLRGLARQRQLAGAGPEAPFRLLELEDGQLRLIDPVTGSQLALRAFGEDNMAVFAQLLNNESLIAQHAGGGE